MFPSVFQCPLIPVSLDTSATVSSCRLCSGFRDGTETSSMLRRWSTTRRAVWTRVAFGRFLYSVQDYGTLCLDGCVTLATTLLALAILWRHSFSQSTSAYSALGALATMRYTNLCFTYLLTYLLTNIHLTTARRPINTDHKCKITCK